QEDGDVDGVGDVCDNCPAVYNPGQEDFNDDGIGNHCQDSDDDGVLDSDEGDGDRDGDGIPDYADYDPTGYFYDEFSGEIITGGRVEVNGPGTITILHNGSSGYYQFLLDPPPGGGLYTLTVTYPPSMSLSTDCPPQAGPYYPSGPNPVVLGYGEVGNTGVLSSNACTNYYLSFYIEADDPDVFNNNFPLRRLPAVGWGDTCLDHNLSEPAEDFLVGSGPAFADQDTYAVGFYNPKGEARLTSIFFQWYDPGSVDLWVYTSRGGSCPTCQPLPPGESPLGVFLGEVGAGDFTGNWEWEEVDLGDGPCIQIPAKSCFFIVWRMKEGESRPRMLGDAGHAVSHSWIYNGQQEEWKCFPGYEYMVKVCLDYEPGCVKIREPDITWSHPYRGQYPCEGDPYAVRATFHNECDVDVTLNYRFWEAQWGLFIAQSRQICGGEVQIPAMGSSSVACECQFRHSVDRHNWWSRNMMVEWTRDMYFCSENREPTWYYSRRGRMTVWPDGPWDKEPVRWGLAPITIPVHNEHADPMRFELLVTDLPENWRADLSWTDRILPPGATENVIITVWPGGVEPEGSVVIKVKAFKCNGEWGYVEIEFLPYPEHMYLGPDGRPVQPVHVEEIRWSPMYPCHNTAYDVSATVVNDGPNSAYPKISFGLAPWGLFFPAFEVMVYDTVLWGGIGGFGRQVVAPYHYRTPFFEYEDLECTYYQQYARNIVIDYPVVRRHCLTPGEEPGTWRWTVEDSTTEYLRDCERWLWSKHRWVNEDSTWKPVTIPIPVYNEEPYLDHIDLWIDESAFPPHIPDGWEYAFDEENFWLEPGETAEANLTIIPKGLTPPLSMPAHVVVHAVRGYCDRDTNVVEIKFMPFTGMCIRDTSGIKVAFKYSESCGGQDPTLFPGDRVDIGLMLDNEAPVSAAQIELGYEGDYLRVVDVATTVRTSGFELVHRQLVPGLHEIALYSTPVHPRILPNDPVAHCALPPRYYHEGLLSIVTVTFEILAGAPAGRCADIWYGSVILDGLPDWEGQPKEPLCLKYEDKGQICFGGYMVPAKCDVTGSSGVPDTTVTLMDLFGMLDHIVGEDPFPGDGNGDEIPDVTQPGQPMWAADANGDGLVNVIDLMKCINRAVGVCDPKVAVADVEVGGVVGVSGRTVAVPVSVSSEVDVAGVVLRFRYDQNVVIPGKPDLTQRSQGMDVRSRIVGDELVVFLSSMRGTAIEAGSGSVVRVPFAVAEDVEAVRIEVEEPIVFTVDEGITFGQGSVFTVKAGDFAPTQYSLAQNYPNPFNPVTHIEYALPEAAKVKVSVYNLLGQVVDVLVDGEQEAGYYTATWDANVIASGVYFYRIVAKGTSQDNRGEFTATRRMVLMK
ncbi:MAG: T9SS type A sorting domain-containing protein, partial [Gemmatimonadota bacterium]